MPGLKMQVASKISSDGAMNLLELEESFGLWKGMKSVDVQLLLTSRILQHSCFHTDTKNSFLFVTHSGTALIPSVLSKLCFRKDTF